MTRVLIYSGTTEGRRLAEILAANGIHSDVMVATEYGQMVMEESEFVHPMQGRCDVEQMKGVLDSGDYVAVVDATHPYASMVSTNIVASMKDSKVPYYRCVRESVNLSSGNRFFESASECAKALKETEGRILLTTGSKELSCFTNDEHIKNRLMVRVLPGLESVKICYDNGLEGNQIIAMQGPFSKEMNIAQIREYGITTLVTKESGKVGGTDTKLEAALETGIDCFVINRPGETSESVYSLDELLEKLSGDIGLVLRRNARLDVALAGIGMGMPGLLTLETKNRIKNSTHLFGAKRMLSIIDSSAEKYPYYTAADIIPIIEKIKKEYTKDAVITILYSGDSGFFSGAKGMKESLDSIEGVNLKIMPGISSLSYMASKVGRNYQKTAIVSAHGVEREEWTGELKASIRNNEDTFYISSGVEDIRIVGEILKEDLISTYDSYVGFNLSYEDGYVEKMSPEMMTGLCDQGLYVGWIVNRSI